MLLSGAGAGAHAYPARPRKPGSFRLKIAYTISPTGHAVPAHSQFCLLYNAPVAPLNHQNDHEEGSTHHSCLDPHPLLPRTGAAQGRVHVQQLEHGGPNHVNTVACPRRTTMCSNDRTPRVRALHSQRKSKSKAPRSTRSVCSNTYYDNDNVSKNRSAAAAAAAELVSTAHREADQMSLWWNPGSGIREGNRYIGRGRRPRQVVKTAVEGAPRPQRSSRSAKPGLPFIRH